MSWDDLPEPAVGALIVFGIPLLAVIVGWGAICLDDFAKERALERFKDCVERGNDPQWCFQLGDP